MLRGTSFPPLGPHAIPCGFLPARTNNEMISSRDICGVTENMVTTNLKTRAGRNASPLFKSPACNELPGSMRPGSLCYGCRSSSSVSAPCRKLGTITLSLDDKDSSSYSSVPKCATFYRLHKAKYRQTYVGHRARQVVKRLRPCG